MPTYEVKSPEGTTYRVNAPEGATQADAIAYVQKNFSSKPKADPIKIGRDGFADALASVVSEQNPLTAAIAQGGNTAMQYVRGLRQMIGGGDTLEGKNQDLLRSEINKQFLVAGMAGDIGAQIGMTYLGAKALPLGAIAAKAPILANPYAANVATGAALGGLKYGSLEDRAIEGGLGAAGGGVGTLLGRAIPAAYQGIKGIVEPFTQRGQENIVGRTLSQFSVDPSRVAAAGAYASKVPGVAPTTAEAALDPGISSLQRQFAVGMTDQQLGNNAARVQALRGIGGTDAAIGAARSARSSAVNDLYAAADGAIVQGDSTFDALLARPSMREAAEGAARNAAERGEEFVVKKAVPGKTTWIDQNGAVFDGAVPPSPKAPKVRSLIDDIKQSGGISQSELSELGLSAGEANKSYPSLFRKGGQTGDDLLETMQQKGWINEGDIAMHDHATSGGAQEAAKDMIRAALRKETVLHPADYEAAFSHESAMDDYLKQWGNFTKKVEPATPAEYSGKTLHDLKLGLDDVLNRSGDKGIQGNAKRYATGTKDAYLDWLDSKIASYGQARKTFADLSRPINSMEVGNEILKKSSTAAEDALGNPTLHNEALSRAVRDGNSLAQRVTGFSRSTLSDTLDPVAMQSLSDVRRDLARKVAADNLGKANGSPTAQNLASQNLMRQIAGPLGMPSGFAESNIWPTLLRPVNWAMKAQDPKIEGLLVQALKDPKMAAALIGRKSAQPSFSGLLGPAENYAIPGLSLGLLDARQ